MRTGLPKQKKTTDIWFDEKDPLIHIRTHNTDLKKRLAAYAAATHRFRRPTQTRRNGCMSLTLRSRFSFRLYRPYSEERRKRARVRQREQRRRQLNRVEMFIVLCYTFSKSRVILRN